MDRSAAAPWKGGPVETSVKQSRALVRGQFDPRQTQPETSCTARQLLDKKGQDEYQVRSTRTLKTQCDVVNVEFH